MESRIRVITLAVADLGRALAFYREGLGLDSAGVIATEFVGDDENPAGDIAMFHLDGNLILALYPRTELAKDAGIPFAPPKSGEFSIDGAVDGVEQVGADRVDFHGVAQWMPASVAEACCVAQRYAIRDTRYAMRAAAR